MLRDDGPLERERMHRRGSDAVREIETEANLGARGDRKVDRIAQGRCPAGMVTEEWPPKVTVRIEPAWSLAKSIGVATVAEPITRGVEPYSFVRRIQIREPPMDILARSLTVCPSIFNNGSAGSGSAAIALAVQVAINDVCCAMAHCGASRKKQERTLCRSFLMR